MTLSIVIGFRLQWSFHSATEGLLVGIGGFEILLFLLASDRILAERMGQDHLCYIIHELDRETYLFAYFTSCTASVKW